MAWTKESREKALEAKRKTGIKNQYSKGAVISDDTKNKLRVSGLGRKHTQETKDKLSEKGLASDHRRLCRSIRPYTKKDGSIVNLDSSWEEALAIRLDMLNIEWIRPTPIKWIDSKGKSRNYFPDFYLPKFELFLDPKNPIAMKQQHEKVSWLKSNVKNLIFLESLEEIEQYIPIV